MTILEKAIKYLNSCGVKTYGEKPHRDVPDNFCVVEKTGGGWQNHVDSATIALQSYAKSKREAETLNEITKKHMLAWAEKDTNISKCALNTDYDFTDPTEKQYRWQAIWDVVFFND